MFKKILFAAIVFITALTAKNTYAAETYSEKITPNKLTVQREDGAQTTINAFRIRGYNVAQLRTLVQACGGSIISADDGYQIVTEPGKTSFTPIAFSGAVTVKVQFNITEIMDKSGKYIKPGEPGWVFLTEYNYNWGSIRDVLNAMGYEIKSYNDDAKNAKTSVVIGKIVKTAPGRADFPTPSVYIGGSPVYIYYEDVLKPCIPGNWTFQYFDDPAATGEKIWVYARDGVSAVRIYQVGYTDNNGNFTFTVKKKLYESTLRSTDVLIVNTVVPEGVPYMVISFTAKDGKTYSYTIGYNGRTGHVNAALIDLKGI